MLAKFDVDALELARYECSVLVVFALFLRKPKVQLVHGVVKVLLLFEEDRYLLIALFSFFAYLISVKYSLSCVFLFDFDR